MNTAKDRTYTITYNNAEESKYDDNTTLVKRQGQSARVTKFYQYSTTTGPKRKNENQQDSQRLQGAPLSS